MNAWRSLRWQLQAWYSLLLFLVIATFGFTGYRLISNQRIREVDEELHYRMAVLAGSIRPALRQCQRAKFHRPNTGRAAVVVFRS